MKKRILSVFLCICMITTLFTATAYAEDDIITIDYVNETVEFDESRYSISFDEVSHMEITSGASITEYIPDDGHRLIYGKLITDTDWDNLLTYLSARPEVPSGEWTVDNNVKSKTDTTITLQNTVGTQQYGYCLASDDDSSDISWSDGTGNELELTGLNAATAYNIYTRVKATESSFASDNSNALSVTTLPTTPDNNSYAIVYDSGIITFDDEYEVNTAENFNVTTKIETGTELATDTFYYIRVKEISGGNPVPASKAFKFIRANAQIPMESCLIEGVKGTAILPVEATISLQGNEFDNIVVGTTEFATNVLGLKATVVAVNMAKTEVDVEISGTPIETKVTNLTITIPEQNMTREVVITTLINYNFIVKIKTDEAFKREITADFTGESVTYKDFYGTTKNAELNNDILDSGEGWTWHASQSEPYDVNDEITQYNFPANTLVLNGVNIEVEEGDALKLPSDTTVMIIGENTVTTDNCGIEIIESDTAAATFVGSGNLTINAAHNGIHAGSKLIFKASGNVDITAGVDNVAIYAGEGYEQYSGTVNATGTKGATALNGENSIVISGGTFNANAGRGIISDIINISGGTVNARGKEYSGICGNEIDISGGTIIAISEESMAIDVILLTIDSDFRHTVIASEADAESAEDVTAYVADFEGVWEGFRYVKITKASNVTSQPIIPINTEAIQVGGASYNIGTKTESNGVTTIKIDGQGLSKAIEQARTGETVNVQVLVNGIDDSENFNEVMKHTVVVVTGPNFEKMQEKDMTLSVQADIITYDMPAKAINIGNLLDVREGRSDPFDFSVTMGTNLPMQVWSEQEEAFKKSKIVAPKFSFKVTITLPDKIVEANIFDKFVQRDINIPENVNPKKITTAAVVENGVLRHVPTEVIEKNGKWYATINSLTNSVYVLINNEVTFTDAEGKWYKDIANEMGSRGIISGNAEGIFNGDANITRGEYAAILVRALGLPENGDASVFKDVKATAWYYGAVGKAYEYGIVNGKDEKHFDPNAYITRQEAMAMIRRAATITEFEGSIGALSTFSDADSISTWAVEDAQWNVGSGLIQGNSDGMICGQNYITRGESAAVVQRLLQKSGLIDVRNK